jgi:hypothetical protein
VIGLNFPADARLAPQFGAFLGARWLRVVLLPEVDLTGFIKDAHSRGLSVLGVIARESFGEFLSREHWPIEEWLESLRDPFSVAALDLGSPSGPYAPMLQQYAARYGDLDAVQGGNEADHISPSSWTLIPAELNALLAEINQAFDPSMTIVGPGLVSGQPSYLDAVDLDLVDAIAVHPYGQRPNSEDWSELPGNFGSVAGLLDSYRYHGKPIWVTEVGVSTHQVSEEFQARYCEAMIKALKLRSDAPVVTWFCADDLMVPEFGLYGTENNPKRSAEAFMHAAGAPEPEPTVTVKAIDVSSHQPANLTNIIHQHRPEHVIVKLYMPWDNISFDHTAQQVASARDQGCTVGGYVWAYRSQDPIATIDRVIGRCASIGLVLPLLWIDCETYDTQTSHDPGPDADWLARAVDHAERVYGMACGIYTGIWWIDGHFPGGQGEFSSFSRLPIWLSEYDHIPDINNIVLPMGWTQAAAKQYSADGIDLNVIRPEYTVYEHTEPDPEPDPDPCENLNKQLREWINTKPFKAPSKKKLVAALGG